MTLRWMVPLCLLLAVALPTDASTVICGPFNLRDVVDVCIREQDGATDGERGVDCPPGNDSAEAATDQVGIVIAEHVWVAAGVSEFCWTVGEEHCTRVLGFAHASQNVAGLTVVYVFVDDFECQVGPSSCTVEYGVWETNVGQTYDDEAECTPGTLPRGMIGHVFP